MRRGFTVLEAVLSAVYVLQLPLCLLAGLLNVTVDDASPDPRTGAKISYGGAWVDGQDCLGCLNIPDAARIHNSTWHNSTMTKSSTATTFASFHFTGASAIFQLRTMNLHEQFS